MTPKWTIRKYSNHEDGSPTFYSWFVFGPGTTPPEDYENAFLFAHYIFRTFPEALAYADSQTCKTRTVEVELPKVEKDKCIDPNMSPAMFVTKTPGNYGIFLGHRHMLTVTAEELKPLALHLLALHYETENQ